MTILTLLLPLYLYYLLTVQLPFCLPLKLNSAQNFASNSTLNDSGTVPTPSTPSNLFMPKIVISSKDVIFSLYELNTKKAYDPDSIPPVVFKTCTFELAPCLGKLFRLCLSTSTFSPCWKHALI